MMTKDEHLAWAKTRAFQYLDAGDLGGAVRSMGSDLSKHPETQDQPKEIMGIGLIDAASGSAERVRRWINGFR